MAYRINPITCNLDYYEDHSNDDILLKLTELMIINKQIIEELKIMNLHLSDITDDIFTEEDV